MHGSTTRGDRARPSRRREPIGRDNPRTATPLSRPCKVQLTRLGGVRYQALICDYDGTISHDGRVGPATIKALERLVASGRRLVLVTGRELPHLQRAFDR